MQQRYPVYRTGEPTSATDIARRHLARCLDETRQRLGIEDEKLLSEVVEEAMVEAFAQKHPEPAQ